LEEGTNAMRFELEADGFAMDDVVHLVRPLPKPLVLKNQAGVRWDGLLQQLAKASGLRLGLQERETGEEVVVFSSFDPLAPSWPDESAIIFVRDPGRASSVATAITASVDALVEGLKWEGLLVGRTLGAPIQDNARVLLWDGDQPLIFLRPVEDKLQLVFNFDLSQSNITRLPAFAVLLDRFVHLVRRDRLALERRNLPTGHLLEIPAGATLSEVQILNWQGEMLENPTPGGDPRPGGHAFLAPWRPGFFKVTVGEKPILEAAAQYFDPRRGDFANARTLEKLNQQVGLMKHREDSPQAGLQALLGILLVGCLLVAWRFAS
ncbi:MAG: hypothetical protein SNJ52_05445, partial [Verrucomicrobiia bacterium]